MEFENIKKINDLKRDVMEEFIKTLPVEDKKNLRNFIKDHPQTNAAGVFNIVRAYIFNTYFRTTPMTKKRALTFAETLDDLLKIDEDEE